MDVLDCAVDRLLNRIGGGREEPSADALVRLHRAFVQHIPYDTIDIQLGRPPGIGLEESLRHIVQTGRGGYCYTLNGAFAALLRHLGYDCRLHVAGVQRRGGEPLINANHLALTVHIDGDPWYSDVGTGDALLDPLPLVPGEYRQGAALFRVSHSTLEPGAWRFDHDLHGAFAGLDFSAAPVTMDAFQGQHSALSTSADSGFVRVLSAFLRRGDEVTSLRSRTLATGAQARPQLIASPDELIAALVDVFGMNPDQLGRADRDRLWLRASAAHDAWLQSSEGMV